MRALALLVAASVIVPVLLFGLIAWNSYALALAETERNIRKTTQVLQEHAEKVLETLEGALDRVDERLRGRSWGEIATSPEVHAFLQAVNAGMPQMGSVGVGDSQGRLLASSRRFPMEPIDASDREYYRLLRGGDLGYVVSPPIRGRISGMAQFNIGRRRSSPDGTFDGVVVSAVYPQYFVDFYRRVASGENESMGLVRADGALLVRFPAVDEDRALMLGPDSGLLRAIRDDPREGFYRVYGQMDGVERIFGYKKLDDYPIYVTYAVATASVVADWMRTVAIYGVFALPATLALVLVAWTALRRARSEAATVRLWADEVRQRAALESALRQSQKLEALGQLTGGVAHDFNNLLTAAQTNLHLLARHVPEAGTAYHEGVKSALQRAEKLTRQLLAFSRQEAVNPEVIAFDAHLRAMGDLLERSIRADIALVWDLAAPGAFVEVDPVQLELAVLNAVVNARDAMPTGGTLTIATRRAGDGRVAVEIRDTGEGMPAEVQARAFEPFFTTKEDGKGTGLGLSMVYGFARQSGGSADIESRVGRGTCLRLWLPLTTRRPTPPADLPRAVPLADRPIRVLVVEDNALVLLATVEGLKQEGFEVLTADHGAAALEVLERQAGIDVVVSDVVMPYGVSGLDLARRIHERWPGMRVLLTSGYSPESLASMGAAADAAVLSKPFTPDQLAARVRALLLPAQVA
ncbi:ATP-binding protein [Azospirillum sp. ST 5-10]|uniref:hybrid sensor histidine kinase/response regulator n=1 Tax=unclassified Azospirillum TaxID=2630922 RepID=UPI003F49FF23